MDLTLREAALLMDVNERTLRDRLRRGDLRGSKVGGRWTVRRADLPLTEDQRSAVFARARRVRDSVDGALASALGGKRRRSALDLEPFAATVALRREIAAGTDGSLACVLTCLDRALDALARGAHEWAGDRKRDGFLDARLHLSRAVARLAIQPDTQGDGPGGAWVDRLEQVVLPSLGGLVRWSERLDERRGAAR
ncbi:helix-turn-helix domain-containing protein [Engelhardtia mirabilis]|uniref:Helix-turn-helix domain-containing protein n=1 Tax=Engelhardtia mirabilis TaxID=2528011 RepID=A0A518BG67_9BACT|nr:hypothetical protein Pla133_09690 [Planctomycetes bacterium Pla133]QDV00229.1 hypothetical protein Pla86_09680 [Planctomycetes bacterium Pla86]